MSKQKNTLLIAGIGVQNNLDALSARDQFAVGLMQVAYNDSLEYDRAGAAKELGISEQEYEPRLHFLELVALTAYRLADALIAERSK